MTELALGRGVWLRALVAGGVLSCLGAAVFFAQRAFAPTAGPSRLEARSTPGVVMAIRDVARLEATQFHIEKVIEMTDAQSKLWGLVQTKDVLLLVAVGDVIAGVDLAKVRTEDVQVDEQAHVIHVHLPAPTVFASTLDERATHVYTRATGVFATRNEQLEGAARREAEEQMRAVAIEEGILDRAKASADTTLRALLRSLGFYRVDLDWSDRG